MGCVPDTEEDAPGVPAGLGEVVDPRDLGLGPIPLGREPAVAVLERDPGNRVEDLKLAFRDKAPEAETRLEEVPRVAVAEVDVERSSPRPTPGNRYPR